MSKQLDISWTRGIKEKKCEKCGKPFMPRSRTQKYCSEPCGLHRRKYKWQNS